MLVIGVMQAAELERSAGDGDTLLRLATGDWPRPDRRKASSVR
jgi:hypothetical protein